MGRKPCCSKEGLSRGAWSAREDEILRDYITAHGTGKWRDLPKRAGLKRCGKSCRLRWLNYLRPGINRGNISSGEEELILRLHKLLGNRWSLIAGRLPGRTDNEIKNYWNTYLSKKKTSSPRGRPKETKKDVDVVVEANDDNVVVDVPLQPDHQVIRTKAVRCCTKAYTPADHDHNKDSEPAAGTDTMRSPVVQPSEEEEEDALLDIPLGFDVEEFMAGIECDCSTGFDDILDHPQLNINNVASDCYLSALLDSEEECCASHDDPMGDTSGSGPSSVN